MTDDEESSTGEKKPQTNPLGLGAHAGVFARCF